METRTIYSPLHPLPSPLLHGYNSDQALTTKLKNRWRTNLAPRTGVFDRRIFWPAAKNEGDWGNVLCSDFRLPVLVLRMRLSII